MTTSQILDPEVEPNTVEIECNGRLHSPGDRATLPPRGSRVRTLHVRPEDANLPRLLAQSILDRLPWRGLSPDQSDRQTLVQTYVRSLDQLGKLREDVQRLVRTACQVNLEFRQMKGSTDVGARDAAMASKLEEMFTQVAHGWTPVRNVLDDRLVSQSGSALRGVLETALVEAAREFSEQFFEFLSKLVERSLLGLVEWRPKNCCGYHFFKQVIVQENEGTTRQIVESRFDQWDADAWDLEDERATPQIVGTRTVKEVRRGKHYYRLARHEHYVMNAVRTAIRNSRVVIPSQVVPLLNSVPDWLYPFVHVIDGEVFRERIVERDTRVEDWSQVTIHEEPIYGRDPAVIIGPYVLTGWGRREISEEQARRVDIEAVCTTETVRVRAPWLAAGSVAMGLTALGLFVQSFRAGWSTLFAVLAAIACVGLAWQAIFDWGTARNNPNAQLLAHWLSASVAFQVLLAGWLVARWFEPLSWATPVLLGLAALGSYLVGRRFE